MSDEMHRDAVEGGNYDVIRARLTAQGEALRDAAMDLNQRRADTFGATALQVLGEGRVRTEAKCTPVDIVQVGGKLLVGYQVVFGLKQTTEVDDVLSVHSYREDDGAFHLDAVAGETATALLEDRTLLREFEELFQYYKEARLIQLRLTTSKLLAVFQTGATALDVKVLRWAVDPDGGVTYIDSRGERDHVFPATHDFEWVVTGKGEHVRGRHPHVNILDTVFVETVGGDLTVKVEDNTASGEGVFSEPVDDPNQSLDDAEIAYARLGPLILISVKPFRETEVRYLVFNVNTRKVARIDAIGRSCVTLPEDQGILFPGGYHLATGESRVFDPTPGALQFERAIHAPNGEDVLYVFHVRGEGSYALYPYNVIRKEVATPISCHGWSLFDDGTLMVFRGTSEPVRVHPMQVWRTPFVSEEVHDTGPQDGSFLSRIGNKDLVRGVSDALTLSRLADQAEPTRNTYEELIAACIRFRDSFHWGGHDEAALTPRVDELEQTAELIVDEFEKVQVLKRRAGEVLAQARRDTDAMLTEHRPAYMEDLNAFMGGLTGLRSFRGRIIAAKDTRYVDVEALDALEQLIVDRFDATSAATVDFLLTGDAYGAVSEELDGLLTEGKAVSRTVDLAPLQERLAEASDGVRVLSEVVANLEVEDPTQKAGILDKLSEVFAHANRVRATLDQRRDKLAAEEGRGEFLAQFRLFEQTVSGALAEADTPEACDAQLSRLLLQLEELEGRFGDFDAFLADLAEQREKVYEALSAKKQQLLEARQKRVESVLAAAERILGGVRRRASSFTDETELAAWFAGDAMVLKLRQLAEQLGELGDAVRADELRSKLKTARQDALRGLRDKADLFDGDDLVKLGKHRFAVNTEPIDLTLVFRDGEPWIHVTGTQFYERVDDPDFAATRPFWGQALVSETDEVYRAEYLAATVLFDAEAGEGLDLATLESAVLSEDALLDLVRGATSERYDEGYDRGVHDRDAARILTHLVAVRQTAGVLAHAAPARVLAALFWAFGRDARADGWVAEARALGRLRDSLGATASMAAFGATLGEAIAVWHLERGFLDPATVRASAPDAGRYLLDELARPELRFTFTAAAASLRDALLRWLEDHGGQMTFEDALRPLEDQPNRRFAVKRAWLRRFAETHDDPEVRDLADAADEAATLLLVARHLDLEISSATVDGEVDGLLGRHARLTDGVLPIRYDGWVPRLRKFRAERVPAYRAYRQARHDLLERQRRRLRLEELVPKVMSAFVRNQLLDQVYLPIVGDNLAKQIGAAGDAKRTDLMGLLMLVSPPGYGKTTLMEYIASRLGLVFVKVNGPALGHDVTSLDPAEAPNATARQEVDKVNLALEMGSNVMLYLDDIQHTHPEFLQKFISLCDAQRRIEGVWNGRTRTYDLRGRTFAVVMAGNPYTESGAKFQVPDMLANRADTYNLGDVLSGRERQFAMSFLENSMTSSAALAPLAARPSSDLYALVRMAEGEEVSPSDLSHDYAAVELEEIQATLRHLFACRDVLLKVNAEYVRSAAMEDVYRTEPRFQLQGSYRNMNKLAEKVVPAMTASEITALIGDHYEGEAQTLTTGAEANLLKLAELRGTLTPAQAERWEALKTEFRRRQLMGGGDDDPAGRITGVLSGAVQELERIAGGMGRSEVVERGLGALASELVALREMASSPRPIAPWDDVLGLLGTVSERLAEVPMAAAAAAPTLDGDALARAVGGLEAPLRAIERRLEGPPNEDDVTEPRVVVEDPEASDRRLDLVLSEIRALRAALHAHDDPQDAPARRARTAADREAMYRSALAALEQRAAAAPTGEPLLVAAVEVIERLTRELVGSAGQRMAADDRDALVGDLKRGVAKALGELASAR